MITAAILGARGVLVYWEKRQDGYAMIIVNLL